MIKVNYSEVVMEKNKVVCHQHRYYNKCTSISKLGRCPSIWKRHFQTLWNTSLHTKPIRRKTNKIFLILPKKGDFEQICLREWKKISIQRKKFSVFCQRNEMEEQELHLSINIFSVRRTNFLSGSFTQQQFDHSWYSEILSATFQWGWRLISSLRGIILHVRQRSVENVMEQKKIMTFKPGSFAQE